jgi:hypothetical protein
MKAMLAHRRRSRVLFAILVFSVVVPICGCRRPPTAQQIVGSWASVDKMYTLDFCNDHTFAFTAKEAKQKSLADMVNRLGFSMIAPSGHWQLNESDLDLSCSASTQKEPIMMLLKVVSWSDDTLVLRFGDGDAVSFVRKPR